MRAIVFEKTMLSAMPRPQPQYYNEMRECAIDDVGEALVFDKDSQCYKSLKEKYREYKPPPDWSRRKSVRVGGLQVPGVASRGFGDTVAKITNKVGIKTCGGCKKRQKKLNKLFPYRGR